MKQLSLAVLCLVSLSAFAQNPPALTAAQIEAYKSSATGISNMARTNAPVFSPTGEIQRTENGQVARAAPGTSSMADQAKYFNGISGVKGYEVQADPSLGMVAAVKVSGSAFADFSCTAQANSQKSVLGRVLRTGGCDVGANGAIKAIRLSMCSVTLNGGACGAADFTPVQTYPVNAYGTLDGLKVGIGCNESNKTCRITLDDSYSVKGNGAQLTAAAAKKVETSGTNSAQSVIADRYTSDQYTQKMTTATAIDACAGQAQGTSAATGVASTCGADGAKKQTVSVGGTGPAPGCSDTPICVRHATRSVSYTQSCVRTFPLTGYSCNFTVPTLECAITKEVVGGKLTNSCADADLAEAKLVRSSEKEPGCVESDKMGVCVKQTWTDYYTQPSKASLDGNCTASPFPMSGTPAAACLNKGNGVGSTCQEGGWFQRTLSDSECTANQVNSLGDGRTVQSTSYLTEAEKAGCGVCTKSTTNDTCYARPTEAEPQDSCANIDFNSCSLTSSTPQSQLEGMTLSQEDVYSCTKAEDSCAEYDRSNLCSAGTTDMTFGVEKDARAQSAGVGNMNQALTDLALIDAVSAGAESDPANPIVPRIFGGDDSRCSKPVGFIGGVLDNDCCRLDLDRPGGGKIGNKCSLDEVKLATARRSNFTVFIGEYCSNHSGFGPFKRCTERTQTYCSFKGLLPRIIQQQGRQQLAGLATSSASGSVVKAPLNFNFYEGKGGWASPVTVNGVVVVPFQYPAYCTTPDKIGDILAKDASARECPLALTQWIATCELSTGCGPLPTSPELGAEHWVLSTVNPLKNVTTAVSRYAMVTGACDPASTACRYEVAAWPAGVGGQAVTSKELSFPLYGTQEQATKSLSGASKEAQSMGDYVFRPVSMPGVASPDSPLPATVRIDYSINGGQTFAQANVPSQIKGTDTTLPGMSGVRIVGGCDMSTNSCTYTVTGTVTVTAKPWQAPERPDCTGFTMGQVSVLDFSKMDLSEWVASMTGKLQPGDTSKLAAVAGTRTQQMFDARKAGTATMTASNPQSQTTARITPTEEFGPFVATLRVSGNYPVYYENAADNVDPVNRVEVDWGDCTIPSALSPTTETVNGVRGTGFSAGHQYASPDKVAVACGGGRNSIAHAVKLRLYSKSGAHDLALKVINTWNTNSGTPISNGAAVNQTTTVVAPGAGIPGR